MFGLGLWSQDSDQRRTSWSLIDRLGSTHITFGRCRALELIDPLNQGNQYGEERIASLKDRAALKKETDLQDCANVFVDLAKNTSITGAKIQVGKSPISSQERTELIL